MTVTLSRDIDCATTELRHELDDCVAFTGRDFDALLATEYAALGAPPVDQHAWHMWARRVHLRWHAATGTGCPLQRQILAQLPSHRFPQYHHTDKGN